MESFGVSFAASDLEAGIPVRTPAPRRRAITGYPLHRHEPRFFCGDNDDGADEAHHFLDACFLCKKPLAGNHDIFMYRGDTPFCSEECRQVQIEKDEAQEKNSKYALKASSRKAEQRQQQKQSSPRIPVSAW
ncbi:uncharacterized protein LOC109713752 [Ananas comosus]|uniref:Uncharacterized protein LOC109713752 n=1 Tax=Ananas comosus TaxID=4615 RepID=A0A6P5FBC9_ANACO|nr:uncharacterized protein LOC109713752 [Ananas comosus]